MPFISEFQDLGAQVYLLGIELGIGAFVGGRTLTNLLPINNSICSIVHWFLRHIYMFSSGFAVNCLKSYVYHCYYVSNR